jgi:PAS domain S-box-containing protein
MKTQEIMESRLAVHTDQSETEAAAAIHTLSERLAELEEENLLLEEVLHRNTRMFEALISNSQDGIALTGPDRRIVRVIKGLTGVDPRLLTGLLIDSLVVAEDRPAILDAYTQLLRTPGGKIRIAVRVPQKNGTVATYNATVTDMLDNPNVQGIVWNYSL